MSGYLPHHRRRTDAGENAALVIAFAIVYGLSIGAFMWLAFWGRM